MSSESESEGRRFKASITIESVLVALIAILAISLAYIEVNESRLPTRVRTSETIPRSMQHRCTLPTFPAHCETWTTTRLLNLVTTTSVGMGSVAVEFVVDVDGDGNVDIWQGDTFRRR